jgi:hypothetical protein
MKNINAWGPGNPEETATPGLVKQAFPEPQKTLIFADNDEEISHWGNLEAEVSDHISFTPIANSQLDDEEDNDSDVSEEEKDDLEESANEMPTEDERNLRKAALDNKDAEGTPLNEGSFKKDLSGSDLDVPGTDLDDADEDIGEEDEENNEYSIGGDNHDEVPSDNF